MTPPTDDAPTLEARVALLEVSDEATVRRLERLEALERSDVSHAQLVTFAASHDFRVRHLPEGRYGLRQRPLRHDAFVGTAHDCHVWLRGYARGRDAE